MSKLVVFRGDAVEHEVPLTGKTVRIGRDSQNDIVLDDSLKGVSRFHAEVRAEGGKYIIVDMKSRNGVWVNKRRIAEKAELPLGVPATLGAYELVLEDDTSSGEFSVVAPLPIPPTLVNPPVDPAQSSRSTPPLQATASHPTRPSSPRRFDTATKGQIRLWSGIAVAVLVISGVVFAIVRSRSSQPPELASGALPAPPPEPARLATPRGVDDPRQRAFREGLTEARKQMAERDYRGAIRDHLSPIVDGIEQLAFAGAAAGFDAENAEALELKKQAEAGKTPVVKLPPPTTTVVQDCGERSGISRRPNEACADYDRRAEAMIVNLQQGRRYLEVPDYPNALARLRLVDSAQKGYQGVDTMIGEAMEKQKKALDIALDSALQNDQAGKLHDARTWYQTAVATDPTSATAKERLAALLIRMNAEAKTLYTRASATWKLSNKDAKTRESVTRQFNQAVDLTLPGDETRINAEKALEEIKR